MGRPTDCRGLVKFGKGIGDTRDKLRGIAKTIRDSDGIVGTTFKALEKISQGAKTFVLSAFDKIKNDKGVRDIMKEKPEGEEPLNNNKI